MAKVKVNITELKKIIKRAVKEAKVVPVGSTILPSIYEEPLNSLFETFGEGDSGFDLYNPSEETRDLEDINEQIEDRDPNGKYVKHLKQIVSLMETYPNGKTFVSNHDDILQCPGASQNAFYECIRVDKDVISLSMPYPNSDGRYSVGWFDVTGKYHPDTENFDEDGNYIGNNA